MKIPRDCNGVELVRALRRLGYETQRQTGSHIQLTTQRGGEHHVSVPNHRPLKVGLLHGVLKDVAEHHSMSVEELIRELEI
ncbi:MAG: type II toxin-antitoxin system HicA family toxin [Limisphaerales bacterium]